VVHVRPTPGSQGDDDGGCSEDDTVAVPFLPIKANAGEQPISERTLKIGGFSDGSFAISRNHGIRSEITLTREEAQQVVAFIQRFMQIEEAA